MLRCSTKNREPEQQYHHGREKSMIVRWLLFETRLGERLLTILEQKVGLAVVQADRLAAQPAVQPNAVYETQ
jgi:hypothetical protein